MNNLVENLITTLILVALALTAWFMAQDSKRLGTAIPTPVAFFETSLQSSITDTDTSMTLVDFETVDGTNLATGTTYGFVIDEGSSNQEIVLGTASTSNQIVSMTRGVSAVTGRTSVASLKASHRRGASVKITDAPVLLTLARILNGDDTVPNVLTYESQPSFSSNEDITTKKYVDDTVSAGAPDAGLSTKGLVEIPTRSEVSSGASSGSGDTSAYLSLPTDYASNSQSSTTTIPITGTDGKLAQGFWDLTENFVFGGNLSVSGTSTFNDNSTFSGNMSVAGTSTMATTTIDNLSVTDGIGTSQIATGTDGQYLMSTSTGATWVDLGTEIGTSTTNFTEDNDYQNTSGRPKYVTLVADIGARDDGNDGQGSCSISIGTSTTSYTQVSYAYHQEKDGSNKSTVEIPMSTIVPGGYYYKASCSYTGTQGSAGISNYYVTDL